jgi:hypothetical protein
VISTGRGALEIGRGHFLWLLAAAICAIAGGSASPAAAGTYDVWSCQGPDGEAVDAGAWERSAIDTVSGTALVSTTAVEFGDNCGQDGGALSVALARGDLLSAPVAGLLVFRPSADTRIASYELSRRLRTGQPPLLASYLATRAELNGSVSVSSDICDTPSCMLGGPDASAAESVVSRPQAEGDSIALRVEVSCVLGICADLLGATPAQAELYRSRMTLEDTLPPADPEVTGELVDGGTATGRASLTVSGEDRGGGIETLTLAIDGSPWQTVRVGSLAPGCRTPYAAAAPCPAEVEQPFEIDTGALAPGDHEASGSVVDAAGNSTEWGPVPFRVERPVVTIDGPAIPIKVAGLPLPPAPLLPNNGSPAVQRPQLRLSGRVATAPAGARVRLRGTLTTRDGRPIARARLTVSARQLGLRDTTPRRAAKTAVTTNAAGRFVVVRRARGAERVTVSFTPRPGAAATAQAATTVRTQLSLGASSAAKRLVKGRLLILRGKLRGAGPSARGALVQIQAIVNGRWTPVGRARVGRGGRYVWRYRFVHLTRDTVFRFRAVVEHVPGWPWPTVRGPRTVVRVDVP